MANLKQIEKYLKIKKLPFKVVDLGREIFTVKGVQETGIDEEQIVKALIVRTEFTLSPGLEEVYIALVLRGRDRVDFKKIRQVFGSKSELAKPEEVQKVAEVPVGAVCPILLNIPIYACCTIASV